MLSPSTLIDNVHLGVAPTWGNAALGIAVGMIAYTGIETISNMAEEARDAKRTVPRGTELVVLAVLGLYVLLPIIALSAMPVTQDAAGHYSTELGTTFAGDPVLGIVENLGLGAGLTDALRIYVGILAAVILLIATNAALIGVSRLTFSMGHYRQLPERLRRVHPRFNTPYVAILVFSGVAALTMVPGKTDFLATLYSFGAMLSFTVAHVSVLRLRQRFPDVKRGWKPPLELPLSGRGAAADGGARRPGHVLGLDRGDGAEPAHAGRRRGLDAARDRRLLLLPATAATCRWRTTVKVVTPEPLGVEEVEYQSVLVAFEEEPFSEEAVATAARLAARRRRGIHVLAIVNVPTHLPLDAPLEEQESRGAEQDRAGQADRRHEGHRERAEGAPGPGGPGDRRGGSVDQGGRDRDAASLPERHAAVRQDASDTCSQSDPFA